MRSQSHMGAVSSARARRYPPGAGGFYVLAAGIAALALQQVAVRVIPVSSGYDPVRQVIFVVTTAVVILIAFRLRSLAGAWVVAAGILLNCIPIVAHGGTMPVAWETVRDSGSFSHIQESMLGEHIPGSKDVLLLREDIRFEALSDRYFIDPPVYRPNIYSFGDFVIFAGLAVAAVELSVFAVTGRLPASFVRHRVEAPAAT